MKEELDRILKLSEKATPGPWRVKTSGNIGHQIEAQSGKSTWDGDDGMRSVAGYQYCGPSDNYIEQQEVTAANGELIAAAVNFLREHGPAIRAAVGGEAVSDVWLEIHETPYGRGHSFSDAVMNTLPVGRYYLSPPATVDVGALADRVSDLLHRIEGFGKAYPTDMFSEVTADEREWLHTTRPGLMDRIAASMGRHVSEKIADDLASIRDELAALIGEKA